jgi:thiol reductant ABC exporter CydD subunit
MSAQPTRPDGARDAGAVLRAPVDEATARASQGGGGPRAARGPIDPRLVRRAGATRWFLAALVGVGAVGALLTVAQAWLLSRGIAGVFDTRDAAGLAPLLVPLAAVFAGKAVLAWLNQMLAQRAAASVKSQLRVDIMRARLERPLDGEASTGGLVTLVTQGLDALDGFYAKYLPQLVLAVVVPAIVGVALLTTDLLSTLIVALTLPLIPVFMALVGWTTEARTKRRWALQTRLARHFVDLVEGLPTLQVFGRARAQVEGLRRTEGAHRAETMMTLRISFLSALVLELLATLSVAIVAVTVGFRVLYGQLDLAAALFILILAPEVYLPVRQVGVHYHDSADGMAAAQAAFALIDPPDAGPHQESPQSPAPTPTPSARVNSTLTGAYGPVNVLLTVVGLEHTYPGAEEPAVANVSFEVRAGQFVVLTGPSGGGKTTVLNALIGFVRPSQGAILVDGHRLDAASLTAWRRRIAYVGQNPGMISGSVGDNVRLGFPDATTAQLRDALDRAGAPELGLDHPVGDDGQGLSAGERRRVATGRALLRITLGHADLLLLDEPTAGLDADAEATLLRSLRGLGVAAVVVSHRPAVIAEADAVVTIGGPR